MPPHPVSARQSSDFIVRCWPFLLVFALSTLTGLAAQSYYGKVDIHLLLVSRGMPVLDTAFSWVTHLGDLPFALLLAAFIAWRYRWVGFRFYLSASLVQLVVVQAIKHVFFDRHLRPIYFFEQMDIVIVRVEGVSEGMFHHFPSGHSAMAFTAFLCLAVLSNRRWWQLLCAMFAVLVAYSRLYLAQHFILDTVAGATIGVTSVVISYYIWQAVARRGEKPMTSNR